MKYVFYNLEKSENKHFIQIQRNEYHRDLEDAVKSAKEWKEVCAELNRNSYFRIIKIDLEKHWTTIDLEENVVWEDSIEQ